MFDRFRYDNSLNFKHLFDNNRESNVCEQKEIIGVDDTKKKKNSSTQEENNINGTKINQLNNSSKRIFQNCCEMKHEEDSINITDDKLNIPMCLSASDRGNSIDKSAKISYRPSYIISKSFQTDVLLIYRSFVYIASSEYLLQKQILKIGYTSNPMNRLRSFQTTSVPGQVPSTTIYILTLFEVSTEFPQDKQFTRKRGLFAEKMLHDRYSAYHIENKRKWEDRNLKDGIEWFQGISVEEIRQYVLRECQHWYLCELSMEKITRL